ncbi:MAG: flagellar motor switch protein FliN [Deltaproteobacteria bacterium]|nr:flagellar motor switch protein FliN [Deltaproteobacteria bacterium]
MIEQSEHNPEGAAQPSRPVDTSHPAPLDAILGDIPVELSVELGRVTMSLRELMQRLGPGSVIPLTKLTGDRLDIRVNDRLVARGEAVALGERYGVRVVELVSNRGEKST